MAGQQAAFIHQALIRFTGWAIIAACGEGTGSLHSLPRKLLCHPHGTHCASFGLCPQTAQLCIRDCTLISRAQAKGWGNGGGLVGRCEQGKISQHIQSLVSSRKSKDMLSWVSEVAVYTGRQLGFSRPQIRMTTINSRSMPSEVPSRRKLWPGLSGEPCGWGHWE